jgi:hypothetical protein
MSGIYPEYRVISNHFMLRCLHVLSWGSEKYSSELQGMFKKTPNFLNSAPTSIESALRLLSAPSVRFWQQTAICPVSLWALVVELHPLNLFVVHEFPCSFTILCYQHLKLDSESTFLSKSCLVPEKALLVVMSFSSPHKNSVCVCVQSMAHWWKDTNKSLWQNHSRCHLVVITWDRTQASAMRGRQLTA